MNFYLLFENALQEDGDDINDEVANFLIEDLGRCYPTILKDLREEIEHISLPKKKFSSKKSINLWKIDGILILNHDKILPNKQSERNTYVSKVTWEYCSDKGKQYLYKSLSRDWRERDKTIGGTWQSEVQGT